MSESATFNRDIQNIGKLSIANTMLPQSQNASIAEILANATLKNIKKFEFKDMNVDAKVVKVYDGDTCTCAFDTFGIGVFRHNIRIVGIDTPELKGGSAEEKAQAIVVRDFVREKILNKMVKLHCSGSDKYGRILGKITTSKGVDLGEMLIENKMAKPYDGGKKSKWHIIQ
jgi:endonuclease YncB( thermonuclease family)